ncbi:PA0061/PA0062 family lipoprotein [Aquipseudomonas guryensis]|jgi:hypothetical protein|uniref:Lipoprotein n=1 Tax=Aquipseudomonas guryensis TaxID=2759165 RepID=A0A7W4H2M3_9GAMM|nr:hypothetical protein [Pseudomonas guryensis]MBB1518620.1 hypothetical protein [Pseudomonas guryensis]
MYRLMLCSLPLLLAGCSLWLPRHDPGQAWIELHAGEDQQLQALQVDGQALEDARYFQVSPGRHELQVRLHFQVAPSNIGPTSQAHPRTCLLSLDYSEFAAGQRYSLKAGSHGFRPWARLYDEHDKPLIRAREGRCGEV